MNRQALWVIWPSFLMAGVLEIIVFAAADPLELRGFGGALMQMSATGIYTLAFFCFWLVIALASWLTLRLATPEPEGSDPDRRWP